MNQDHPDHPARAWKQTALSPSQDKLTRLRLAAMAGHMSHDLVTARRAALVDLLSDGRPHRREVIWETVEAQLGQPCWGKRPKETLIRDLRALRRGGLRIGYSRQSGAEGYYLQFPLLERPAPTIQEQINWQQVAAIRQMSVADKNQLAFGAADFALRQKRLILAQQHPEWDEAGVEQEARRLVYGSRQRSRP